MINILPPEEKKEIYLKSINKLIVILGLALLFFSVCLILILHLINFYILEEKKFAEFGAQGDYKKKYIEYQDTESLIKKHNETINRLNLFYKDKIYFSDKLEAILLTDIPDGVSFSELFLSVLQDQTVLAEKFIIANIYGNSETRDKLVDFKNNIEKNEKIKDIYFSPESWVNSKNVKFYLKFKVIP